MSVFRPDQPDEEEKPQAPKPEPLEKRWAEEEVTVIHTKGPAHEEPDEGDGDGAP
jgi:hypothetical protein